MGHKNKNSSKNARRLASMDLFGTEEDMMSPRTPLVVQCLKAPYASKGEASSANSGQRPYACPLCSKWHLSSKVKRTRVRDR